VFEVTFFVSPHSGLPQSGLSLDAGPGLTVSLVVRPGGFASGFINPLGPLFNFRAAVEAGARGAGVFAEAVPSDGVLYVHGVGPNTFVGGILHPATTAANATISCGPGQPKVNCPTCINCPGGTLTFRMCCT
jgi:hypothetical protein